MAEITILNEKLINLERLGQFWTNAKGYIDAGDLAVKNYAAGLFEQEALRAMKAEHDLDKVLGADATKDADGNDVAARGLVADVRTTQGDITTLQGLVGDLIGGEGSTGSINEMINNAIDALNLPDTYEAKGTAAELDAALEARLRQFTIDSVAGEASVRENEIADLKDNAYAYTDALRAEYEVTKYRVDTFLDSKEIAGTVDTLHEIQEWMNGAGADATDLSKAIADEAIIRAQEDLRLQTMIEGEAAQREGEIADLKDNAYDYADEAAAAAVSEFDTVIRKFVADSVAAEAGLRSQADTDLEARLRQFTIDTVAGEASVRESEIADLKDNAYQYADNAVNTAVSALRGELDTVTIATVEEVNDIFTVTEE